MKSPITKLAAAAVIIVAVLAGIHKFGGSIDPASVAWGNVISRVAKVDYVHFLFVADPQHHRSVHPYEGWYSHGKMVMKLGWYEEMSYDDGQIDQSFDRNNTRTHKGLSEMKGRFFSWISKGLLAGDNEQFTQQMPASVGDDFLIYRFDPPEKDRKWIDSISITVGRNSLLPIQLKTYHKYDYETGEGIDDIEDGYTLLVFDYEAPEKPPEFFEPPTISEPPHGTGEIVLNGEEVMIDVSSSRDIKTMVMRLYSEDFLKKPPVKYKLQPKHFAEISFILKDGVRSITATDVALCVNHAGKIGMGDVNNWPDKKYRNISATLFIRPTEKENIYLVEVSCWLDTIRGND
ncbi:MAG TPA: hypothetical protein VMY06_06935 [Sedimentisphaerales bacterium]|nr:hypothetical protein [Sedimentisphaerales bacterium]